MKSIRDEAGQTLVFTAFLMACLLGFMALAIDVGVLIRAQRKVQTAADAAAIAGTLEYYYHGSANAVAVAKAAAGNNGISDPNQVTVNIPPSSGWHTGASYLEVIVNQPNPTVFIAAFGAMIGNTSLRTMNVGARAVGGIVPGHDCGHVTNKDDPGALTVKGGASVVAPHCKIQVDSSSPEALCVTGNNANAGFLSDGVDLVNPQQTSGNCNKLYPAAQSGAAAGGDPFANSITFPNPTDPNVCDSTNTVTATTITGTLSGYTKPVNTGGFATTSNPLSYKVTCFYTGVGGPPTTLSNATLGDSTDNTLFIFKSGVAISGTDTINGTMDLSGGPFCQGGLKNNGTCNFSGSNTLNITAPANVPGGTSYAWNGMAFVVPTTNYAPGCDSSYGGVPYSNTATGSPDACLQMQFGSGSGNLDGLIYAPDAALYMQDNGGGTVVTGFIVNSLFVNSSLVITDNYSYEHPDSPLSEVALVE